MKPLKIILIILGIIVLVPIATCSGMLILGTGALVASDANSNKNRYICLANAKTDEEKKACPK